MGTQHAELTRRTVLSAAGAGITAGLVGSNVAGQEETESDERPSDGDTDPEYVLAQGDGCVPVQPLRGEEPVEAFYEFFLPERYASEENGAVVGDGPSYSSGGTAELQRPQTSVAFLYQGPERLSLVFVHGSLDSPDGGSVTFRIAGLPSDGGWLVKDDLYRDPESGELAASNYDNWDIEENPHRIDWTWSDARTDGGAFGDLGDDFEIAVYPAFNEAAALYDEYYEGTLTDWEFLSGAEGQDRIALDMEGPILLATGRCADVGSVPAEQEDRDRDDDEDDDEDDSDEGETDDREDEDDDRDEDDDDDDRDEDDDDDDRDEDDDVEESDDGEEGGGDDDEDDDEDDDGGEEEDEEDDDDDDEDDDDDDDEDDDDDDGDRPNERARSENPGRGWENGRRRGRERGNGRGPP
ncbi:hypothetical protein [Halobellus sp. GM3]|uniref:hypothetical protein n=1 Tax=Halobellus sp. GM3 TaxID=3458410 RepID=UPI00403D9621